MNISIKDPSKSDMFGLIFQHIKCFTEDIIILFEKDRVFFQSMDSSRVSIFELYIPSYWFDKYEHNETSAIPVGLKASLFFKILNTREKLQETNITFDKNDDDKLFIQFVSEDKSVFNKRFEIPLIELESDYLSIPEVEYNAEFSISSGNFANIINQLKIFGDTIDIECSEEKIELFSFSEGSGKMSVDIEIEELSEYSINENEIINISFSLNVLHNICLYNKISKEVDIKIKKDSPMKIVYNLGDENTKLVFYLAPKIND
jgi:proliferating cell nuclear antigen PCNA